MADQTPPAYEETVFFYRDKPHLATMISGGVFIGVAVYFITGLALGVFEIKSIPVQVLLAFLPVLLSINMGTHANTTIKIDTKTGYIEAKNKEYSYEAYAHEPEMFQVLEKKVQGPGDRQYKDYKLTIKVDEETTFDVPLEVGQVRQAIANVEKAKSAVPIVRDPK